MIAALAATALCWLCVPELALSQPANINLINLNNGQLCVLGNQATAPGSGKSLFGTVFAVRHDFGLARLARIGNL